MATIASSNFTTLAYTAETTYGTCPSAQTFRYTRFTGESFQFTKESISSNNINPSRQITDLIQTGFSVNGGINIEVSAKSFDEFIEAAMWQEWGQATDVDITATFAATGNTITKTAGATDPFAQIIAKQFVRVSGASESGNNGIFQVTSATDDVLTIDSNYTLTNESGASITVVGCVIKNPESGLTSVRKSFFFEKAMEDLSPIYYMDYSGCMVNSMTISAQSSSILTGSFDFMGKTSTIYNNVRYIPTAGTAVFASSGKTITLNSGNFVTAGVIVGDKLVVAGSVNNNGTFTVTDVSAGVATVSESVTDETVADATDVTFTANHSKSTGSSFVKDSAVGDNIMNSVSHVGTIRMGTSGAGGVNINVTSGEGVYFQSLDFTVANNLRGVQAIGQMGNVTVSPGQLAVTGNMNAYFQDDTMYEKFVDGSEFSLSYEVQDENDEAYVYYFPRATIGGSTMSAGGNDQDLVENMTWQALMDSTLKTSIMINRLYTDYSDVPDGVTVYTGA